MCLIITGKSAKIRSTLLDTNGLIADIYSSNPDGIGIMYSTTKGLKVVKVLPKSQADATAFITKLPNDDRELAIHFRWTTHGDTDLINCHPYDVVPGYVAMMHNGVLKTGNAADTSKSDTWHFIKTYLADPVHDHPALIHNEAFLTMVADYIGDNRFVFMDGEGRMSHVNYDQGVEHDGLWFSNTYAWKPTRLIANYYSSSKHASRYTSYATYGKYGSWGSDDLCDDMYMGEVAPRKSSVSAHDPKFNEDDYEWVEDEMIDAESMTLEDIELLGEYLFDADVEAVEACLEAMPMATIDTIFDNWVPSITTFTREQDLSSYEQDIYRAALDRDVAAMHDFVRNGKSASTIAEVLCYYLNWSHVRSQPLPALLA
jgi:predicted glutamine amidotransferase